MRDSSVALAFAQVGIGTVEAPSTEHWQGPTEIPEDADAERVLEPVDTRQPAAPLMLISPPAWRDVPLEPMRWLATNRISAGDVTILSGDGGGGKTTIALQLAIAVER